MRLFTLTNRLRPWLVINREAAGRGGPPSSGIETPEGCTLDVILGTELTKVSDGLSKTYENGSLKKADIIIMHGCLVLKPWVPGVSSQALVRLQTPAGVGGKVFLTAAVRHAEDKTRYEGFHPPAGVRPLCDDKTLKAVQEGVEVLDLFVLMQPDTSFRVQRTGVLKDQGGDKLPSWFNLRWDGELMFCNPPEKLPILPQPRGADAFN